MHRQNFRGCRDGMTLLPLEDNLCEKAGQRREEERKGRGLGTQLRGSVLAERTRPCTSVLAERTRPCTRTEKKKCVEGERTGNNKGHDSTHASVYMCIYTYVCTIHVYTCTYT